MSLERHIYLPPSHPFVEKLMDVHIPHGSAISIPRSKSMPVGQCYENVRQCIRASGGSAICGWLIAFWPGRFVEALYHAVWKRPDGKLVDVTACAFPRMRSNESTFVIDEFEKLAMDGLHPSVPSRFLIISDDDDTKMFAEATRERTRIQKSIFTMILERNIPFLTDGVKMEINPENEEDRTSIEILGLKLREVEKSKMILCRRLCETDAVFQSSRNEICPCGSGLKYKKCHGA